jgi:peptidoglycan lytic transglycosylase
MNPALTRPLVIALALLLGACAFGGKPHPQSQPGPAGTEQQAGVKLGEPYQVGGVWYYPRRDNFYDVTGVASWYGSEFHGKNTANGEVFDMNALSAAHTTLPLPSYVRVTNLANGRNLVLRVNDRGPFVKDRVLDVSRRVAQLLGFEAQGTARVRVQVVQADGTPFPQPIDASLTPAPVRTADDAIESAPLDDPGGSRPAAAATPPLVTVQPAAGDVYFVQIGAYSSEDNARRQVPNLGEIAPVVIQPIEINGTWLYRLRLGGFDVKEDAERVLAEVQGLGFTDARIFTEAAR